MTNYRMKNMGEGAPTCTIVSAFEHNGENWVVRTSTTNAKTLRGPVRAKEFNELFEMAPEEYVFTYRPVKRGEEYLSTTSGKLKLATADTLSSRWVKVRPV